MQNKFRKVLIEKFPIPDEVLVTLDGLLYRWTDSSGEPKRELYENGLCYHYIRGIMIKSENFAKVEDQIAEILAEFDFAKVYKVIRFLHGGQNDPGLLPIESLKDKAKNLLERTYTYCYEEGTDEYYVESGGFKASYWRDTGFSLDFMVDSWTTTP